MVRILLCDDDCVFSEKLRGEIRASLKKQNVEAVIHTLSNGEDIPNYILSTCDIAFLDIDFNKKNYTGLDIARKLRALRQKCVILFVTNYIEYAPEGYEIQAFRYLLKDELDRKLEPYLRQAISKMQAVQETFQISISGEIITLSLSDILYVEAQAHVAVFYVGKEGRQEMKEYRVYSSLKSLEEQLVPRGFLRIQKSYLVNMRRLKKFQCANAQLDNGTILPVSEKNYNKRKKEYLLWKGRQ